MQNIFILTSICFILLGCGNDIAIENDISNIKQNNLSSSDLILRNAFKNQQSNIQVQGEGKVIKLLADDNEGSRHQKFILKLTSTQTLLISHNIDLSTKIDTLKINDSIEFYGEYEWNKEGGIIHWTHDDPNGTHIDGWLKHKEILYR